MSEKTLVENLKAFGCSEEFIKIALYYKALYRPEIDIEEFVEFVEEEYAKVEEEQFKKAEQKIDASGLFGEFESEEEL